MKRQHKQKILKTEPHKPNIRTYTQYNTATATWTRKSVVCSQGRYSPAHTTPHTWYTHTANYSQIVNNVRKCMHDYMYIRYAYVCIYEPISLCKSMFEYRKSRF